MVKPRKSITLEIGDKEVISIPSPYFLKSMEERARYRIFLGLLRRFKLRKLWLEIMVTSSRRCFPTKLNTELLKLFMINLMSDGPKELRSVSHMNLLRPLIECSNPLSFYNDLRFERFSDICFNTINKFTDLKVKKC